MVFYFTYLFLYFIAVYMEYTKVSIVTKQSILLQGRAMLY